MARSQKRFQRGFVTPFLEGAKGDIDKAVRRIALQLLRKIIEKTPIDTGRAASGWMFAYKKLGGQPFGKTEKEGLKAGGFRSRYAFVSIINNVKHIMALEFGHSKQAPAGMVRLSMLEMRVGKKGLPKGILDAYRKRFDITSKRMPPLRATR
jgi:hypothetical protein